MLAVLEVLQEAEVENLVGHTLADLLLVTAHKHAAASVLVEGEIDRIRFGLRMDRACPERKMQNGWLPN